MTEASGREKILAWAAKLELTELDIADKAIAKICASARRVLSYFRAEFLRQHELAPACAHAQRSALSHG